MSKKHSRLLPTTYYLLPNAGFTLIELIIVIAILGVLTVVVLVAINPAERLAQTRDVGRKSTVAQLGHAIQSYYVSNTNYPVQATWAQDLIGYGEIATFPPGINYSNGITNCTSYMQPGDNPTYCYKFDSTNGFLVYAKGEAIQNTNKCTSGTPYFVFSSADSRGGTICSSGEPNTWISDSVTYVD